ncbi:MAG TPA: hypothetical protein DCY27_00380 [Desulfobacterales bacterium]|nr:hypothetical protein [Desulfobacterales bacterium]
MKRPLIASLLFIALLCPSVASSRTLTKIPTANISDSIKNLFSGPVGSTLVPTTMALRSDSAAEMVAQLCTIPVYAYNPALGTAASFAVGLAFESSLDIKKAFEAGAFWQSPSLAEVANSALQTNTFVPPDSNSILFYNGKKWIFYLVIVNGAELFVPSNVQMEHGPFITDTGSSLTYVYYKDNYEYLPNLYKAKAYQYEFRPLSLEDHRPANYPPSSIPSELSPTQVQSLKDALAQFLSNPATRSALQTALKDLIKNFPEHWSQPAPITAEELKQFFATNNYNNNQQYIDNLTNLINNTEGDTTYLRAELERAKNEQAKEEAEKLEDTYPPIASSGFAVPYNPGEYDIPARFDDFLDTVKSSGLFSFSSSFFNSLPGGGSPVYTVDGGQTFGTHTIDLSQTMSAGLAVLKTILLACFGFLSIRAVIMKR